MPHIVVGCCEMEKLISGLFLNERAILDILCQQDDLVYGRPIESKTRLLLWVQWVVDWCYTGTNESLEDFKGDTQQRYGTVAVWVPQWLFCHTDRKY